MTAVAPEPAVVAAARAAAAEPPQGTALDLWASCVGGTESECAAELAALGWQRLDVPRPPETAQGEAAGLVWERGSVYGRAPQAALGVTLRAARTVTRVTWLAAAAHVTSLAEVRAAIAGLDVTDLPFAPFAVRAERHGTHPFTSVDVAREAGAAVIDGHRAATGRRLPVDLDDPAVVLRVEVHEQRLRAGWELTAQSLHRRDYYRWRHRAALNPAIAAALLVLGGWRAEQRLLDPCCGGGTIPIEAARAAAGLPPQPAGHPTRLDVLGLGTPDDRRTPAPPTDRPAPITGLDRDHHALARARQNAAAAGIAGRLCLHPGDLRTLADVGPVDCVVANPPYGLRAGPRRELRSLYRVLTSRAAERLPPGGRLVVLTPAKRVMLAAAAEAGLETDAVRTLGLGAFDAFACRFRAP